jgi:hypothetical protein
MRGTFEFPTGADGEMTPHLRTIYRAPEDAAYWDALEARIHASILGRAVEAPAWWQVLGEWSRIGLLAAGLTVLAAGLAALRSEQAQTRAAFEIVLEASPSLPAPMSASVALPGPGDRTERDPLDY